MCYDDSSFNIKQLAKEQKTKQVSLIALTNPDGTVKQYLLSFEKEIIPLTVNSAAEAFDYLFKLIFIFNFHYEDKLKSFFNFLECLMYKFNNSYLPNVKIITELLELQPKD